MALDIYGFIRNIEYYGFFQYLVPFLISFSIIFALLEKTQVFGQNKKNLNIGLSLLLSFSILTNTELLDFMNVAISNISLMIILFAVVMLLFMFVMKIEDTAMRIVAVVLAVFATIWALVEAKYFSPYGDFTGAMYTFLYYLEPFIGVIIILAIITFFVFIIKYSGKKEKKGFRIVQD